MNKELIQEIAIQERRNSTGICFLVNHQSELDDRLLAQCMQKIPLIINGENKYLLSTLPIIDSK